MSGRGYTATNAYRYGFNGKEKDDEAKGSGNSYDFGARIYDPRIGRWFTRDPLAGKYPGMSPFNAFANNPIQYKDPDGKDVIVASKYQGNFNKTLTSVFGDLQKGFSYNDAGKLEFKGDVSKFSEDQKYVFDKLNSVMESKDVTNIIYEKVYTVMDKKNNPITIDPSKSGGEATILKKENRKISQNYIVIDPNGKTAVDVFEVTDNYYKSKGTNPDPTSTEPNFKQVTVTVNPENLTWHAIGHVIYAGQSQEQVIDFENKTRQLSTPKLSDRKPDETHNKTVTQGSGAVWEKN
jgi:RHS repeat-associated protein